MMRLSLFALVIAMTTIGCTSMNPVSPNVDATPSQTIDNKSIVWSGDEDTAPHVRENKVIWGANEGEGNRNDGKSIVWSGSEGTSRPNTIVWGN